MTLEFLSDDVNRRQRLSWSHYIFAGIVSLFMPVLVACVQSVLVFRRGYRLGFAILYGFDIRMLLRLNFWVWTLAMVLISFLLLLPLLRFPVWRRLGLASVCFGWTWFIFFCEAVTRGYG